MNSESITKRKNLISDIEEELKKVNELIDGKSSLLAFIPDDFMQKIHYENRDEIDKRVNTYNDSIKRVQVLNNELTKSINDWFSFTKDEKELKKIFFPIRFMVRKKKIKKRYAEIKDEISSIVISHRFMKDEIVSLEKLLEEKAIVKLKQGKEFEEYSQLLELKNRLLDELMYLLPTVQP